jgi:hypothetical protein
VPMDCTLRQGARMSTDLVYEIARYDVRSLSIASASASPVNWSPLRSPNAILKQ